MHVFVERDVGFWTLSLSDSVWIRSWICFEGLELVAGHDWEAYGQEKGKESQCWACCLWKTAWLMILAYIHHDADWSGMNGAMVEVCRVMDEIAPYPLEF